MTLGLTGTFTLIPTQMCFVRQPFTQANEWSVPVFLDIGGGGGLLTIRLSQMCYMSIVKCLHQSITVTVGLSPP